MRHALPECRVAAIHGCQKRARLCAQQERTSGSSEREKSVAAWGRGGTPSALHAEETVGDAAPLGPSVAAEQPATRRRSLISLIVKGPLGANQGKSR